MNIIIVISLLSLHPFISILFIYVAASVLVLREDSISPLIIFIIIINIFDANFLLWAYESILHLYSASCNDY